VIGLLLSLALAQSQAATATETPPWPTAPAGRILSTPDWSDYHTYPPAAQEKEQQGRVRPEIRIGADGTPIECRIVETSNFPELDAGTCERFMQMRFEPARDASGQPVESHYTRWVNWRLTDEQPFASSMLRIRLQVDSGRVTRCKVEAGEGQYVAYWSSFACSIFRDFKYYLGEHASRSVEALIEVRLDAGDGATFLQSPWADGTAIAAEKVAFTISPSGDASECAALERHGFGPRGLNNLSQCGRLLATLWFAPSATAGGARKGTFETRVVAVREH